MKHVIHQLMTSVREHEARYSSTNDFCNMKHAIHQLMTSVREHEARYSSTNDFCKGT